MTPYELRNGSFKLNKNLKIAVDLLSQHKEIINFLSDGGNAITAYKVLIQKNITRPDGQEIFIGNQSKSALISYLKGEINLEKNLFIEYAFNNCPDNIEKENEFIKLMKNAKWIVTD